VYSVLNCYNIARHTELYLGELWFNVTVNGNAGCFKKASKLCSKCYCVLSVPKTFTHKGVQTLSTHLTVNVFVTLAP
jgi:hypothetical protein